MHQSGSKPILYRQGVIKNNQKSQKNESETYAFQLKQKQQKLEEEMNDARYQYLNQNYTDEQKLFNCIQALKDQKNGKIEPFQKQAILTYIENLQFFIKYQKYYDISEVMEICEPKQLQKGEPLFLKGEIANSFYILLEGEAAVIVENNIKKKIDNSQEQLKKLTDHDDNKINFVSQSQKDIDITKKIPMIQAQYNLNEQNNNLNKVNKNQEKQINTKTQNITIGNQDHNNNINLPQNSQNKQISDNFLYPQKSKFFKQSFDESKLSQSKSSMSNQNLFPNFKFDMPQNKNDTSYNLDFVEMKESKDEVSNKNNNFRPNTTNLNINININKSEDQNYNSQNNKNISANQSKLQQNTDCNGDQSSNCLNINSNNNFYNNNTVKPKITNKELRRGSRKLSGIKQFDLDNSLLKSRKKSIVLQPLFSILMEKKDKLFCDGLTTLTWKDIKNPFYFLYKNIFCPKIMKKGDQFGESSLLTKQTRTASIIAQTDCYLIQISKQNYKKYFHKIFQQKLEIKRLFLKSAFQVSLPKAIENQLLIEINISLKFQYNQILFHQNDVINNDSFVYIIKKGQVQIYVDIPEVKEDLEQKPLQQQIKELKEIDQKSFHRKGPNVYKKQHYKQKKICIFGPGEFIGLDDFVKNLSQRQYTVQAKSKVSVFGIRKNRFLQLIDEHYMIKETFINKAKKYHKIFQYMEDQKDANNILAMLAQDNQDQEKYIQKMPKALQKKISQVKSASNYHICSQDIYIYENKQKQNFIENNSALKENQQKQLEKEQINKNSNIFDIDAQSEYLLLINDVDLFKPGISSEYILKYKSQEMGTQIQQQQSMLNKQKNFAKKQQIQKALQNQQKQIIQQNIQSLENIEEQKNIENEESQINNVKSQFNGQKKQFLSNNISLRNSQNQTQIIKAQELFQKIKSNNLSPSKSQINHTSPKKPFIFSHLEKNNSSTKLLQDGKNNYNFVQSQNLNNSKYICESRQIQSAYLSRSLKNNQKINNQLNNQNLNLIKNDSNQNIYENTNEFYNSVKETEVTDFSVDKQQQNQLNFNQVKNNISNRNYTEEDNIQETQNSNRQINKNQNTTYPKFQSQSNNNIIKINFSNKNPNLQNQIPEEKNEDNFNNQQLNSKKKNFYQKFDSNLSTPSQQVQKKQLIFQNYKNFTTKSQQSLTGIANFSNYVTSYNLKHMKSDNQLDNINNYNNSKSQQNLRNQIQSLENQNEIKTDRKQIYDIIQECRQQGLNALQVSKKLEKLFPDEKKSFLELKLLEKKDDFYQVTIENPLYQDNHYNQLVHYSLQCRTKDLKKTQEKKQRINIVLNPQMYKDCQLKNKEKLFRIKNKKIGKQPFQSLTIKSETSTDINNNYTEPSIQQNINECQYDKQYQVQMKIDNLLPEQQYKNQDLKIENEDLNQYQFGLQNNNKKSTTHTHRNYFKPKKSLKFKDQNLLQIKNNTGSQKQNINKNNQQQVATETEFNNYQQDIQPFKKNEIYKMFNQFEKNVKNPKIIRYSYNNQEENKQNQCIQKNQNKLNILENYLSNPDRQQEYNQLQNDQNKNNTHIISQQTSFTSLENFNGQQLQNKYNDDSDYISNNQKTSDKTQINENLKLKKSSFYQQADYNNDQDNINEQEQNQDYDQIQEQAKHQNKKYKQTQNKIDNLNFKQKYPNQKKVSVTSYIQFNDSNLNTVLNNKKQN